MTVINVSVAAQEKKKLTEVEEKKPRGQGSSSRRRNRTRERGKTSPFSLGRPCGKEHSAPPGKPTEKKRKSMKKQVGLPHSPKGVRRKMLAAVYSFQAYQQASDEEGAGRGAHQEKN